MDNLSHSVAGLAVGAFVDRRLAPEPDAARGATRTRLLWLAGLLASNFPDLDLLFTSLLPPPLGYLLHHRGHTHTFLYALPQALLLAALLWLAWPAARRLLAASGAARKGLAWTIGAGLALHIAMDFLNSYGVHPFHPFDSRWLYGDMVFIIEPVFWIACGAPLAMMARALPLRIALLALLLGVPLYFAGKGYLAWPSYALLALIAAALSALQLRAGACGVRGLAGSAAVAVAFVALQGGASALAAHSVASAMAAIDPAARTLDTALTPYPAHPLCWSFVAIGADERGGNYTLRRGIASLAPAWIDVASCPRSPADLVLPPHAPRDLAVVLEVRGDLGVLRELARTDCHFSAWMRFARAPALMHGTATDIRFASGPHGNFTTLDIDGLARQACPRSVPQWGFPRGDLLRIP